LDDRCRPGRATDARLSIGPFEDQNGIGDAFFEQPWIQKGEKSEWVAPPSVSLTEPVA